MISKVIPGNLAVGLKQGLHSSLSRKERKKVVGSAKAKAQENTRGSEGPGALALTGLPVGSAGSEMLGVCLEPLHFFSRPCWQKNKPLT